VLLIFFLVLVLVPYLIVVSTSLRRGNFAPSGLLPDKVSLEHWKYVLGIPYQLTREQAKRALSRPKRPFTLVLELD
jgi:ABC-type maltose transport system permease subunit